MFPVIGLGNAKAALREMYSANGVPVDVRLRDGTEFEVKAFFGPLTERDLTAGAPQNGYRLRFLGETWDAASPGRMPQKGDQITLHGRRSAIESVRLCGLGGEQLMYVVVMHG
jgi:hypothetical protein